MPTPIEKLNFIKIPSLFVQFLEGDCNAAVVFDYLVKRKPEDINGWFYWPWADIEADFNMNHQTQKKAYKKLVSMKLIHHKLSHDFHLAVSFNLKTLRNGGKSCPYPK